MRLRGFRADKGRSHAEIEKETQRVRRGLGLSLTQPIGSGILLFERLAQHKATQIGREVQISTACNPLPKTVFGLTIYDPERDQVVVAVSEDTYEGLERDEPHARFTLAHELGHLRLHQEVILQLGEIPHKEAALYQDLSGGHQVWEDAEWQANSFAGAFLMPARAVAQVVREHPPLLAEIAVQETFGVSLDAATIRLRVLRPRWRELLEIQ